MSLLMKALEKAAKDREETANGQAAPAHAPAELTLEPIQQPPAAEEPPPAARAASVGVPPTAPEPAQAAAVLRAARRERGGIGAYLSQHRRALFGSLVGVVVVGYGAYLYLQIMHPQLFAPQRPFAPASQIPSKGVVGTPATLANQKAAANAPAGEATSLLPPLKEVAARAAERAAAPPAAAPVPAAPATTPATQTPRDTIKVTRGGEAPTVNPVLAQAYQSLERGDLQLAQRLYGEVIKRDPRDTSALLGLAASAAGMGDSDQAARHYVSVLEVDPRNALAQAGLIGILGRADPIAAETRLKNLISREPSAFLYFTLGNLYADQNQWPAAQQAYFKAHHLQPDNPDYAYNLAIGLEHLAQPKLALEYYRRATQLAANKGHANFDVAVAQERIGRLERIAE
jgi:tetratricopeptide (TPR) repeat protein